MKKLNPVMRSLYPILGSVLTVLAVAMTIRPASFMFLHQPKAPKYIK